MIKGCELINGTVKYYECHINIEPQENREPLEAIAFSHGFRLAKFAMHKGGDEPDSFMTGRGQDREALYTSATKIKREVEALGIPVYRLKIEAVILDERF